MSDLTQLFGDQPLPSTRAEEAASLGDVIMVAEGIEVKASWGHIYGPVDLTLRSGGVTVLIGAGGRGRTALLLTLAGRMKPSSGQLEAFGRVNDAHHLFKQAALANIDEVDGIGQTIRVHDIITEQIRWAARGARWVRQSKQADLERICAPVFGEYTLPTMDAMVEELPELTGALLRIAVANIRKPPVLVVGGIDKLASVESSRKLLGRLVELGKDQTVITADVNGVDPNSGIREQFLVENLTNKEFAVLEREADAR